jgi:hypothetical protein
MIEIQLSTKSLQKPIVSFHANTLAFHFATGNQPYIFHVGRLKTVDIVEKRGKQVLVADTGLKDASEEIDAQVLPRVKELVAAVQKAMTEFQAAP